VAVSGSFTNAYTFTPTETVPHRICAYVAASSSAAPTGTQTGTVNVRLPGASLSAASFSADATEDEPVTVTLSGTSEANRYLYAFWRTSGTCASTAADEDAAGASRPLAPSYGVAVSGSFTNAYTFTPTETGTHRICAYISEQSSSLPLTSRTDTVSVRAPGASLSTPVISADASEGKPVTVTLSGTSEAGRYLYAFWRTSGTCASTAADEDAAGASRPLAPSYGVAVSGSFTKAYTFTPTETGTHRICAYISEQFSSEPLARSEAELTVRRPRASAGLTTQPPAYLTGQTVDLTAMGTAELAASFAYTVTPGETACDSDRSYRRDARALEAGSFSVPIRVTFTDAPAHTICLYVARAQDTEPLAVGRVVARKQPLVKPALQDAQADTARRATFAWVTADSGQDTFVLEEAGEEVARVTGTGTYVPPDPYADEDELSGVDDYYAHVEDPSTKVENYDPSLGRIERRPDGTSVVALDQPLPPGRYTWTVLRSRDSGEHVVSDTGSLRVVGPPLTELSVSTAAHPGSLARYPGYTTLKMNASPFARVTLTLRRGGRQRRMRFDWGETKTVHETIDWKCPIKGTSTYRFTLEARDDHGNRMTRSGKFRVVSPARCRSMKAAEKRALTQRRAAERRRAAADARRQAAKDRKRINRFIANCRALGGTAVRLNTSDGPYIACRAPWGGYLPVPH
jgi:hypothetical protein